MIGEGRPRVCFIIPEHIRATETHYFHLYELIETIAARSQTALIVHRASDPLPEESKVERFIQIRGRSFFGRMVGIAGAVLRLRLHGFRRFYCHYSNLEAVVTSALVRPLGARTFVWSCVQFKAFSLPWRLRSENLRQNLVHELPLRLAGRLASRLVTCSSVMAEYYSRHLRLRPEKIAVLPNWVNGERFSRRVDAARVRKNLGVSEEALVVLFVHTLAWHRGVRFLPNIVRETVSHIPDALFVVVGSGTDEDWLAGSLREQGLSNHCRLVGAAPNERIAEYFAAADVLINPSPVEAFGRVLLESMAAGVPFVSMDGQGAVPAFLAAAQLAAVVPSGDEAAFIRTLRRILSDPEEREYLAKVGLEQVERYGLHQAVKGFEEIVLT